MDRYSKGFVLTSPVCFFVTAGLGNWMGSGEACSCPGQAMETIRQSALMQNVDEAKILDDLNRTAGRSNA